MISPVEVAIGMTFGQMAIRAQNAARHAKTLDEALKAAHAICDGYVTDRAVFEQGIEEVWKRGLDLNQRPFGYEPNELPDCSTPPRVAPQLGIEPRTT